MTNDLQMAEKFQNNVTVPKKYVKNCSFHAESFLVSCSVCDIMPMHIVFICVRSNLQLHAERSARVSHKHICFFLRSFASRHFQTEFIENDEHASSARFIRVSYCLQQLKTTMQIKSSASFVEKKLCRCMTYFNIFGLIDVSIDDQILFREKQNKNDRNSLCISTNEHY